MDLREVTCSRCCDVVCLLPRYIGYKACTDCGTILCLDCHECESCNCHLF
jgi:hypothetical protein